MKKSKKRKKKKCVEAKSRKYRKGAQKKLDTAGEGGEERQAGKEAH